MTPSPPGKGQGGAPEVSGCLRAPQGAHICGKERVRERPSRPGLPPPPPPAPGGRGRDSPSSVAQTLSLIRVRWGKDRAGLREAGLGGQGRGFGAGLGRDGPGLVWVPDLGSVTIMSSGSPTVG